MLPTKSSLEEVVNEGDEINSNLTETMRTLLASHVLVSGLQGLGAEVAKNLILAGVESITLHDEGLVELWDLSGSFLFSEDDVGKKRALVSFQKLRELNNSVACNILTTKLTKENLSQFQVVVFTDISLEKAIEFDRYCHLHEPPIAFIKTEVRGLFGSVFCDFGPQFTVVDVDGEEPYTGNIVSISNDDPALIECVDCERLDFQDGDLIVFSDVQGMTNLNGETPRKIKNVRHNSFTLDEDTTNYGAYEGGGIVTQVKQPKELHFKPLSEALKNPGNVLLNDFSKSDRPPLLHLAFQALDKFRTELGRFPVSGFEDDAKKLISIFTSINDSCVDGKLEEINHKLLRYFAFGAKAVLNPMATMFGGIVGQEVVKACSGKFHPLFQFLYFDSLESLPTKPPSPDDVRPKNSRYDAQISVFGSKLQKKLEMAEVFIVGVGALGCEFLKNVALMGVSCGDNGKLTITDDDVIEKSNLSTQFLFRDFHIQKPKSIVAAAAVQAINKHIHIKALQSRASPKTKNVFDDSFWENLNVVITAVDNVDARLYIDERCIYFKKLLLDCGTLGAKFNTQMIIPHLSENYRASRDPPEKKPPLSTVHSFPYNIDHCLTWARSEFKELLEKTPSKVNAYLENPREYTSSMLKAADSQARDTLKCVVECLDNEKCSTFEDCIKWARLKFEDYFVNRINQLTLMFPKLCVTRSGAAFWTPPKRFPSPLQFSVDDPIHLTFVMAAAILRAKTFGISKPDWIKSQQELGDAVKKVIVPNFVQEKDALLVTQIEELIGRLERCKGMLPVDFKMNPLQFDKDGDDNYHMEMITGLAIMRARNYDIPQIEKLKAKFNAGLTRPAMKSTATATGLVCLELYKAMDGAHKLEDYRNTFANLALPLLLMAEPVPPKITHQGGTSWTAWDRWILKDNPTLENLLDFLEMKGFVVVNIKYDYFYSLYFSIKPRHRDKERVDKKLVDLVREVTNKELPSDRKHFDLTVICENIEIPKVSVYFRQ